MTYKIAMSAVGMSRLSDALFYPKDFDEKSTKEQLQLRKDRMDLWDALYVKGVPFTLKDVTFRVGDRYQYVEAESREALLDAFEGVAIKPSDAEHRKHLMHVFAKGGHFDWMRDEPDTEFWSTS